MTGRRERSHLGLRIRWIANPDRLGQRQEPVDEFVRDLLLKQQAGSGNAGLSLVVENGEGRSVHRGLEMRIFEDDVRAFAAQLELDALEISGRSLDDFLSGDGRAGECDLIDAGCSSQVDYTGYGSKTRHDVDDARRDADFSNQVRDAQRGERRQLRRLQDYSALPAASAGPSSSP